MNFANIGIGTSTPQGLLNIVNTTALSVPYVNISSGNQTSIFLINNLTNVGIGTSKPTHKLNVVGDINATGEIYVNGGVPVSVINTTSNIQGLLNSTNIYSTYNATYETGISSVNASALSINTTA